MAGHYHKQLFQKKQHGFTIVELLIVIVVIAILAAIVIVAYNGIQSRARDARRLSDLGNIQTALGMYYIDNGRYPAANGSVGGPSQCISSPGWACWAGGSDTNSLVPAKYMANIPIDPSNKDVNACAGPTGQTTRLYGYRVKADGSGYMLGTWLENVSTSDPNYLSGAVNYGDCVQFMNWAKNVNYN